MRLIRLAKTLLLAGGLLTCGFGSTAWADPKPGIVKDVFGTTADGVRVDRYTLTNANGMTVRLITFGATITELRVPDRGGNPSGYDLAYLHNHPGGKLARVATMTEPTSGRVLKVYTNQPAIIFYTGNFLDGTLKGKGGVVYKKHAAFTMETGTLPDSVNQPSFTPTILRPGQTYRHTCIYRFSTK